MPHLLVLRVWPTGRLLVLSDAEPYAGMSVVLNLYLPTKHSLPITDDG